MSSGLQTREIAVTNAEVHNLKSLNLKIETGKTHLFTGLSGTGKSSLLRNVIYQSAIKKFSSGVGQLGSGGIEPFEDLGIVTGLPPLIDVTRPVRITKRSTLGTLTGLHQLLQTLFVNYGIFHCPGCQQTLTASQPYQVRDDILKLPEQTKVMILAPLWNKKPEDAKSLITQAGYVRVKYGSDIIELQDFTLPEVEKEVDVSAVVDRLIIKPGIENRLLESIEAAWKFSQGYCEIMYYDSTEWKTDYYADHYFCPACRKNYPPVIAQSLSFYSGFGACEKCQGLGVIEKNITSQDDKAVLQEHQICPACQGLRLGPSMHALTIQGKSFADILQDSIIDLCNWVQTVPRNEHSAAAEEQIQQELLHKIEKLNATLNELGIGYLSLYRATSSLSTGEYQRAILGKNSGRDIQEISLLFEEPSSGLHPADIKKLINHLHQLKSRGNTLLLADQQLEVGTITDQVWELGPLPGDRGGYITFSGNYAEYLKQNRLSEEKISRPQFNVRSTNSLKLKHAKLHNLQNIDLEIQENKWTCITGVSGSGKSTLIMECLGESLKEVSGLINRRNNNLAYGVISDYDWVKRVKVITQEDLKRGKTARIISALGIWDTIRYVFSKTKYAKIKGWSPKFFSWNNRDFRCAVCEGNSPRCENCTACRGSGLSKEVLRATFKDLNLEEIFKLNAIEALEIFGNLKRCYQPLWQMQQLGLEYLPLGRKLQNLSQGELSRIHLSRELVTDELKTLFLLDELGLGLHQQETMKLIQLIYTKQLEGHTFVTIEHRQNIISASDLEIVVGPGAGKEGGRIVDSKLHNIP